MQHLRRILTLALAGGALLSACSSDTTGSGAGKVTVRMTDAPFPFSEVSSVDVFVVRVDARTSSVSEAQTANADDNSGWTTIATPNALIDLMQLNGGQVTTLGTASLPNGTYNGFRLIIDPSQSSVTLTDNSHPDVVWPSASHTGVKINLASPLTVSSDSSVLLIDFDIGSSFVMRGNDIRNNGLLFKPVIHAAEITDVSATIHGSVVQDSPTGAALEGATVELLTDGSTIDDTESADIVRSTVTDASGNYTFDFLVPGSYEIRVTPPTGSAYQPAMLTGGVTLTNGQTLTVDPVVVTKP
jgi:hypothetical protein